MRFKDSQTYCILSIQQRFAPMPLQLVHLISIFAFLFFSFFIKKKSPCLISRGIVNNELAMTYSHMDNPTLPSAERGFTSDFGKESGGSLLLWAPAQLYMDLDRKRI